MNDRLKLTFAERAELSNSEVAKRLYTTMSAKESTLCVAVDETDPKRFLALVEAIGPEIAVLKTHIDTLEGFTGKIPVDLSAMTRDFGFLIFEDRKFADIGRTVKNQYTKGIFHIIEWADIVNAHPVPGPGIVDGLRAEVEEYDLLNNRGVLLIAQMSSSGNLITPDYTQQTVEMAKQHPDFVIGFIGAGEKLADLAAIAPPDLIIFSPGVKLSGTGDAFGQTFTNPETLVAAGADLLVVGRDIYQDPKPVAKAKQYRKLCWEAYQKRISAPKVTKADK